MDAICQSVIVLNDRKRYEVHARHHDGGGIELIEALSLMEKMSRYDIPAFLRKGGPGEDEGDPAPVIEHIDKTEAEIPWGDSLDFDDWMALLGSPPFDDPMMEFDLRLLAWRTGNHPRRIHGLTTRLRKRKKLPPDIPYTQAEEQNMRWLLENRDQEPASNLMRCEIYRELGEFNRLTGSSSKRPFIRISYR